MIIMPDMDYLDRLRLARVYVVTQLEKVEDDNDQDSLNTLLHLVEHTISEIEFLRLF